MFDMAVLAQVNPHADEADLHRRIGELERAKAAAAAGQARCAALLDAKRRADEAAAGVPRAKRGRGVASEVALARHDSPNRGSRHLGFAKALVYEMPHTLAALESGVLSEWRATLIVRESACLSVEDRRTLDAEMCGDVTTLAGMGDKRIEAEAKKIAYRLDPAGRRRPGGESRGGPKRLDPAGTRLHGAADGAVTRAEGCRGLCGAQADR